LRKSLLFSHRAILFSYGDLDYNANRPDGKNSKTPVSGAGGMSRPYRADQIFHTLSTTRHRCSLNIWALTQNRGVGHRRLVTPEMRPLVTLEKVLMNQFISNVRFRLRIRTETCLKVRPELEPGPTYNSAYR